MNLGRRSLRHTAVVCCLAVGAVGVAAQTPSARDTLRSRVQAREQEIAAAARIFLDAARTDDERAAAVAGVTSFVRPADIRGAVAVARSDRESPRIRALAVERLVPHLDDNQELVTDLLRWLAVPATPVAMRRAAMDAIAVLMFSSRTKHERHDDLMATLRRLATDADVEIRDRALSLLAAEGDEPTRRLLRDGLRSTQDASLPPARRVELLGLHATVGDYEALHQLMLETRDEQTRIAAVRVLGAYQPSRTAIVGYLHNAAAPEELRLAAVGALHANDTVRFTEYVIPVVRDERASDALRAYAISAVRWRRRPADPALAARGGDAFDQAVRAVAGTSKSDVVRRAAREYLSSRGLTAPE